MQTPRRNHGLMSRRRERLEGQLGSFMRQYGRKKHPGHDPNDRKYDRELAHLVKTMDPAELDELLRGEAEDQDGAR